ncbi:hypothetical protein Tbd_0349 [Thiobacillus denitrificans ATCC 25259]|uniref:Uncharacterized protein n=1 Tax=Thiobacillus denitrificans (strain ATCC 25259 / T1) TaxID=292415 RepID=Q3SLV1_THIDA|nr:hypothetical protein Tbd_0349 [Thiobacillus denitrificans ATCC 25259]
MRHLLSDLSPPVYLSLKQFAHLSGGQHDKKILDARTGAHPLECLGIKLAHFFLGAPFGAGADGSTGKSQAVHVGLYVFLSPSWRVLAASLSALYL